MAGNLASQFNPQMWLGMDSLADTFRARFSCLFVCCAFWTLQDSPFLSLRKERKGMKGMITQGTSRAALTSLDVVSKFVPAWVNECGFYP